VKALDPDGNTVLLGQRDRSASQVPSDDDTSERFSLLRKAAAVSEQAGPPTPVATWRGCA